MIDINLQELCKDYINWVLVMINGGGYTAEVHRSEIHEKIHEKTNIRGDVLYNILAYLDKEIGLPTDQEQIWRMGEVRHMVVVNKYGLKLYERLQKEIKEGKVYPELKKEAKHGRQGRGQGVRILWQDNQEE